MSIENTPDDPNAAGANSEYSLFEGVYWQALIHREVHCKSDDVFEKRDVESMYFQWNERFGTNLKPRWK